MTSLNLKTVLAALKKYKILLLAVAAGILLLLWPSPAPAPAAGTETANPPEPFRLEELEAKLQQAIASMEGAGETAVVLTLKTDVELKLREDGGDIYGADPMVVGRVYPEFQGALVICQGAGRADVRFNVVSAVQSLTGLGANRITVVTMREGKS
jgi:stage III sporulation protein AG